MRTIILTFTALLFSSIIYCQSISEDNKEIVSAYKKYTSCDKLAEKINSDFTSEQDKASAIFLWITQHIKYDYKLTSAENSPISYSTKQELVAKQEKQFVESTKRTIKTKRAVCQGYADLYKRLCDLTGIECVVISGASKTQNRDIGKSPSGSGHAWNAIKINEKWYLLDATWGAGYVKNKRFYPEFQEAYFMTDPDFFYLKHWPKDEKWILTDKSKLDFKNAPLYYSNSFGIGLNIKSPKNGILSKKKDIPFIIKTNSLDEVNRISYSYSFEKYSNDVNYQKEGEFLTFEIPGKRNSGYVTIIINNKAAATYKTK